MGSWACCATARTGVESVSHVSRGSQVKMKHKKQSGQDDSKKGSRCRCCRRSRNDDDLCGAARGNHVRVVSARSSFFLLMRSFSVSASRRACWMRDCMASGDTSLAFCEFIFDGGTSRRGKRVSSWAESKRGRRREPIESTRFEARFTARSDSVSRVSGDAKGRC